MISRDCGRLRLIPGPRRKGMFAQTRACAKVGRATRPSTFTMTVPLKTRTGAKQARPKIAKDFQDHLADLEEHGLVVRIDRPINKDTELHPLARWQFQGAVPDEKRRAFVFTNVVGSDGRKYSMPVVVGALAASPEIYARGMGVT